MQTMPPSRSDDQLAPGFGNAAPILPSRHGPVGTSEVASERGATAGPQRDERPHPDLRVGSACGSHHTNLCDPHKAGQDGCGAGKDAQPTKSAPLRPGEFEYDLSTPGGRLRFARERLGFLSVPAFCRYFRVNKNTYFSHESGHRALNAESAKRYAAIFSVTPQWLLYGSELNDDGPVSIVGVIQSGAGGKIRPMAQSIVAPPVDQNAMEGMLVEGNDLYPAYRDGDMVFTRKLDQEGFDLNSVHGMECVVQTEAGDRFLRQVTAQADGRATLIGYNAPPVFNVAVVAAEPVLMVRRNAYAAAATLMGIMSALPIA